MSISIKTNIPALRVMRLLGKADEESSRSMERIASGKRIVQAGDDAAGLAISTRMEARIKSMGQAHRNAKAALGLTQVSEGALNEASNMLVRMRELSVQAASDAIGDQERTLLNNEATQLNSEIERLANSTRYFGTSLINGEGNNLSFQVGPDSGENNVLEYDAGTVDIRPDTIGSDDVDLTTIDRARESIEAVDEALYQVTEPRSRIAAFQSRLQSTIGHLASQRDTLKETHSQMFDTDIASETVKLINSQVRQKAGLAVLAQANQSPQMALKLLTS